MKILLDECVPLPLRDLLVGHECFSVQQRGWTGIKNGDLLRRAEVGFDLFITSDQGIRYQQNLTEFRIAVLQFSTNDLRRIRAAAAAIRAAVSSVHLQEFQELIIP